MGEYWVPKFGEWVRNSCAAESNPRRDGRFVRVVVRTGVMNRGTFYEVTNGDGGFWLLPMSVVTKLADPSAALTESTAKDGSPVAWMRAWASRGEVPHKERKENGRMAWPLRFKLLAITEGKILPDDVPLYTQHSIN